MSGIYIILGIILYLVIIYKVEWEDKDLNTYLYFYDCNYELCTTTTKQNTYYSKLKCENNICPHIVNIIDNNLILKNDTQSYLYNYIDGNIINNEYMDYKYINNNQFIVTNIDGKQGIMDISGNIVIEFKYDNIINYKNGFISYLKDNMYGIDHIDNKYTVTNDYEDIVLINDTIFAAKKDNLYKIYEYTNLEDEKNINTYNYVYAYNDIIMVMNNNKIDILTTDLNSTLLMKIDSFYEYTIEKERASLNIHIQEDKYLIFKVYTSELEYTEYKYDVFSKKLV